MRGRPFQRKWLRMNTRNTPAYAGKTSHSKVIFLLKKKHPRVCGEDHTPVSKRVQHWETPPRMRGRLNLFNRTMDLTGNTPAYAGKTSSGSHTHTRKRKHPRVCGEDSGSKRQVSTVRETPPRMRGRPLYSMPGGIHIRNTPAYAGKTVKKINLICQ